MKQKRTRKRSRNTGAPNAADADSLFMTQPEVARLLKIANRSLERFRQEGRGPAFRRFGRRVLYGRSDVLRWADEQRHTST
jgi:helix-turn-helix protein